MRKVITGMLVTLIFSAPCLGQTPEPLSVEVIRPAPFEKNTLYTQTLVWMAESFRSSKEVVELKDKDLGVIVGNGASEIDIGFLSFLPVNTPLTFKLRIDIRDKRYRFMFSSVELHIERHGKISIDKGYVHEEKIRARFDEIATSLDEYLAKAPKDF